MCRMKVFVISLLFFASRLTGFLAFDYTQGNATVADQQVSFVIETVLPYWAATECRVCLFFPLLDLFFSCADFQQHAMRNLQCMKQYNEYLQVDYCQGIYHLFLPISTLFMLAVCSSLSLRCLHPRALFLHLFDAAIEQCECSRSFCVAYNMQ